MSLIISLNITLFTIFKVFSIRGLSRNQPTCLRDHSGLYRQGFKTCRLSYSLSSFVVNRVFIVNSLLQLRAVTVFTTLSRAWESCYCYYSYSCTCSCNLNPPAWSRLNRVATFDPPPLRWTCTRSRTRSPPYSKKSPASSLVRHSTKPVSNASEYFTWLPLARAKLRTPASPVPCPRAYRYLCQYAAFDTCSTIASPVRQEARLIGACTFVWGPSCWAKDCPLVACSAFFSLRLFLFL